MLRSGRNAMLAEPLRLSSNAGYASLAIESLGATSVDESDGFDVVLVLTGSHWRDDGQRESVVRIERMWLSSSGLHALHGHIANWLAHPVPGLDPLYLDGSFDLAGVPGQDLSIAFGARVDTIADRNPVVTISFRANALRGEFHFVTDQSCLRLFAESLKELLFTAAA